MIAIFRYSPEFRTLPEYTAHAGQVVEVVRGLRTEEAGGPETDPELERMYLVRAQDGWEGHAWMSELEHLG